MSKGSVTLLDYGAGNVRSIINAIQSLGYEIKRVNQPSDIENADCIIFPGVGSFESAMKHLEVKGFLAPLKSFILSGRPFFGICIGMQVLFEASEECDDKSIDQSNNQSNNQSRKTVPGLGIIPGCVEKFQTTLPVPHIGWNSLNVLPSINQSTDESNNQSITLPLSGQTSDKYYFVHSYRVKPSELNAQFINTVTDYGERFVSSISLDRLVACQFHPEKSSHAGLAVINSFLEQSNKLLNNRSSNQFTSLRKAQMDPARLSYIQSISQPTELSKRLIACLDVRTNDQGDLIVTKGDQYDVRESVDDQSNNQKGSVRNLGKPVDLARSYFDQGADEITFLNICSFRAEPLGDLPLLAVLEATSTNVFVPLCVGGGIRDYVDTNGQTISSLAIADAYFRSGADKISIGSDAVIAAEEYINGGRVKTGRTSIEQISYAYGVQAVVVSVDPRRVWVANPSDTHHACVHSKQRGPNGEEHCWWQCTIKGGREGRDVDVLELCSAVADLGAGEILLNSMDADGQKQGYDIELIDAVCKATRLPVIASSGAGTVNHFSDVFRQTSVQAALAAGIFHRKEVPIAQVKAHLADEQIPVRM